MIKQLDLVIVPVSDQDRARDFYTDKLGFELRGDQAYGEGNRWLEVAPPGAEAKVALIPPMGPDQAQPGMDMRTSFTTDDIDAEHARLREAGVDIEDIMRMEPPVPPMAFFRDLDGNRFLLLQRD
jgi:catechol 2,3-dioxygenase-like lactoylglutathione lyase family enzyme